MKIINLLVLIVGYVFSVSVFAETDVTNTSHEALATYHESIVKEAELKLAEHSRWLASQARRFRRGDPGLSKALGQEAARFRAQSIQAHVAFVRLKPRTVLERLALHVDARSD